jgi:gliding motility-associated-like protein
MPSAFPEREWVEHSALWYSDDTDGQIALELVNDLPGCIENDVAIDDLFFGICGSVRLSSAAPPPPFCPGDASAEIALRGRAEGLAQPQYQWQHLQTGGWQDLPGATDTLLRLLAPTAQDTGLYRLAAAEWGNLGSRTCALYSPPIRLQALPSYHFRDTATICQGEIYLGLQNPGTYTRRYQTSLGCDSLHTLELRVRGGIALYLPNAFSPDDDGHNDTLQPEFSALDLDGFHWQVFDRWGNLLFESRDPAQAWDGHARGRRCETGVYLSTLRFEVRGCQNAVLHQDVLLWGN